MRKRVEMSTKSNMYKCKKQKQAITLSSNRAVVRGAEQSTSCFTHKSSKNLRAAKKVE